MTGKGIGAGGILVTLVVLAGCGTQTQPGGHGSTHAAAKGTLTVQTVNTTAPRHWTLRCDPVGGTAPNAAATCKALSSIKQAFDPAAHPVMCPMIMADAGRATVTGIYFGQRIHESVVDGGCDLSRWGKLKQVFS